MTESELRGDSLFDANFHAPVMSSSGALNSLVSTSALDPESGSGTHGKSARMVSSVDVSCGGSGGNGGISSNGTSNTTTATNSSNTNTSGGGSIEDTDADAGSPERGHEITIRALVTNKEAGVIIGKAGHKVAEIRDRAGVRAGVSKVISGVTERVLSISGSLDGVALAVSLVASALYENSNVQSGSDTSSPPASGKSNTSTESMVRLLIPHQQMGSIIGRQGAKIWEIQEAARVRMVAAKEMLPQSTERVVEVQGVPDSIRTAVKMVSECLLADAERGQGCVLYVPRTHHSSPLNSSFSSSSCAHHPPHSYNSRPMPPLQSNQKHPYPHHQNQHQNQLQQQFFSPPSAETHPQYPAGSFHHHQHRLSQQLPHQNSAHEPGMVGSSYLSSSSATGADSPGTVGTGSPGPAAVSTSTSTTPGPANYLHTFPMTNVQAPHRSTGSDKASAGLSLPQPDSYHEIKIPADMIGCVIGRGGSKIQEIRRLSGARINISRTALEDTGERLFTVRGNKLATEQALVLLYEQLEHEKARRSA